MPDSPYSPKGDEMLYASFKNTFQTKITTADGEPVILYHANPLTREEQEAIERLTKEELVTLFTITAKNPMMVKL